MARVHVALDSAGVRRVMESARMTQVTRSATREIAEHARAQGHSVESPGQSQKGFSLPVTADTLPVRGSTRIRDARHMGLITIDHPAGLAMEAKYSLLTRAAAAAGMEVTPREPK